MSKLTNYSKAVWLPLIFIVALVSFDPSLASAQEIEWRQDLAEAKAEARDTNRLVWLHFTADWCVPCKRLDSFVFTHTGVIRASDRNTVAVRVDADAQKSLVKRLAVPRVPYDIVMTPSGRVIVNRTSPKNSSDFLTMFNRLDLPIQALTAGDREVINAELDQLHRVVQQSKGLSQQKNNLDLEGPSHKMASTTVEGQRLERGFESTKRAAEIRVNKARSLKNEAERYMAEEERRQKSGQGPKISENPFFKTADSSKALPTVNKQTQAFATGSAKTVSNAFVQNQKKTAQQGAIKVDPNFVPPLPPKFAHDPAKKVVSKTEDKLSLYEERKEFSFSLPASEKTSQAIQKSVAEPVFSLAAPKSSTPEFAERKQVLPELSQLKNDAGEKADDGEFAYASIDGLRKSLRSKSNPNGPVTTPKVLNTFADPVNNSLQAKAGARPSKLGLSLSQRASTPATNKQSTMETDISIPQPPVMMEGIVQIAETMVPAVEGRLVSAEQEIDKNDLLGKNKSPDTIQKQISRTDRLLANVNFFGHDDKPVQSAPQTFAVPGQPVQQPQIVINLNTGNAAKPQPAQAANQGVVIQPNFAVPGAQPNQGISSNKVALASSTTSSANRAKISNADIASAVRSKYALKGKCPVTLLSEGRWVDGNKQIGCVHRDRVYLFASAAQREDFLADPDKLSPLLAGFDPVIFEETGKLIEGDEKFGTFMGKQPNQRIVLFKTSDTRDRFQKDPSKYLDVVRQAMADKAPKNTQLR